MVLDKMVKNKLWFLKEKYIGDIENSRKDSLLANEGVPDFQDVAKPLKNVSFDDALEQTEFGKFNILLTLTCGICLSAVNCESFGVGYVIPSAQCDLDLDVARKGIIASASQFGVILSCIFCGYYSDTRGRKPLLVFCLFMAFICSFLSALVPSFWGFAALRFLNGIFISGPSAVIFAYLNEFNSPQNQGKAMACMGICVSFTLVLIPVLGWLLLPMQFEIGFWGFQLNEWRLFVLICSLPTLVAAIGIKLHPESPKFLFSIGKTSEALEVLNKMYTINTGDIFPVESLDDKLILEEKKERPKSMFVDLWQQTAPLLKRPYVSYMVTGAFFQAVIWAVSGGLYIWYSDLVNQLSENKGESMTVCQILGKESPVIDGLVVECDNFIDSEVYIQNIIVGIAYGVGFFSYGFLVSFLGNRNILVSCMGISTLCTVLLCVIKQKLLIDFVFIVVLMVPGISITMLNTALVSVTPTHLGAMTVCIAMTAGRLGSIVSSSVLGFMLQWNCIVTFLLYAASLAVCLLLAFVFPKKQ